MGTYLKYGFVIIEHEAQLCPRCRKIKNRIFGKEGCA